MIEIHGVASTFNVDTLSWTCQEEDMEKALNVNLDTAELSRIDTAFLEGGVEGAALAMIQKAFKDVKVLAQTEPAEIPEVPGVDN